MSSANHTHMAESQRAVVAAKIANLGDGQRADQAAQICAPVTQTGAADVGAVWHASRTQPVEPRNLGEGIAERIAMADAKRKAEAERAGGPCDSCRHFDRCTAEVIACEAFSLFARLGSDHSAERWRFAARQPSAAILERLRAGSRRPTEAESRRQRESLAVTMQRDRLLID